MSQLEETPDQANGGTGPGGQGKPAFSDDSFVKTPIPAHLVVGGLVLLTFIFFLVFGLEGMSERIVEKQADWLVQTVQRSAIECFVIEGRFPRTEEGVAYLKANYGLQVDEQRYIVYYESMGDNLLPQVKVLIITPRALLNRIHDSLGVSPTNSRPQDSYIDSKDF
ncbi:MAG: hypothetical protein FWH40_00885 [Coriobacteriia bacterium]|nr:hypothetical protein [Coriobacteriia bacterium]